MWQRGAALMLCEDKSLNGNWVLAHLHAAETVTTLQDQQQDSIFHIKGPWKTQSTASPSKSITVLPIFSTLPSSLLTVLLHWNRKTPIWQNCRETQGHRHLIHDPENLSSKLVAAKGWILQGNLLQLLDVAGDEADRAEKTLRFKQSIAELLNWTQLQIGLQNITRQSLH